jgi:hypothetical protein
MNQRKGKQGGWVGLIAVLLALVIVAWLSKDALKQYGLLSDPGKAAGAHRPAAQSDAGRGLRLLGRRDAVVPDAGRARAQRREHGAAWRARTQSRQVDDATR